MLNSRTSVESVQVSRQAPPTKVPSGQVAVPVAFDPPDPTWITLEAAASSLALVSQLAPPAIATDGINQIPRLNLNSVLANLTSGVQQQQPGILQSISFRDILVGKVP